MAAYGAIVSLVNDLELIPNHPIHSFSFETEQITSLSQTVQILIHFMETYDSHCCSREAAQALESRIASAAHAAHDVIESHVVDQILAGSTLKGKAICYFLFDLQKAIDNMDFVKRKAMQFQAKSGLKAEQQLTYSAPTSSQPLKNVMVGFEDVAVQLMEKLTTQRVIPIVGMGGLGKTTLVRFVYDHSFVEHHFDVRLWATISQEYNLHNILTRLVYGETQSPTGESVSELGETLHKKLWGRRYLIILDDMWSVEAWDEVHTFLPDNGNGSCVVVTTRLSNLAAHLSSSLFNMSFLDNDKSWVLFCGNAFGEEDCPLDLEGIGKRIVKRCRGLPLSIIVIGGHLKRSSRTTEYWERVANYMNPISSLEAEDEQCLNIISLSYEHLPCCLKPCFLYMGIFMEDEWIFPSMLIGFWIAEGFLRPKKGLSLEEVAEDYLEDLIDRNLILVRSRGWNGKVEACGIHDIVRELCMKVGKKEKFMCVLEDATKIEGISTERRIVIPEGKRLNSDMIDSVESALLLRSLIRLGQKLDFDSLWVDSRLLRVSHNVNKMFLEKDGTGADFQQFNLRYLAFPCENSINTSPLYERLYLPFSISLFWNMQTLNILHYGRFTTAPYEIWKMPQVRHLELHGVCLPDPDEKSKNQECIVLENLHTLSGVVNLRLTEEVLKRMPNIKDLSVTLTDLEAISSYDCLHNLSRFNKLESLKFQFTGNLKWRDLVPSFTFPSSVEELCLLNSGIQWEDLRVMIKSLPRLGSSRLDLVQGSEWNLADEDFPRLRVLNIGRCDDWVYWKANNSHFPVLEVLEIWFSSNVSEIPFDFGEIPTLRCIKLYGCSASAAISAMRIVVEQEDFGNQDFQLDVGFQQMEKVERFQEMMQELGLASKSLRLYII